MFFPRVRVRYGMRLFSVVAGLCLALVAGKGWAGSNVQTPPTPIPPPGKTQPNRTGGDPVSLITGGVEMEQTDVAVPCPGVSLNFTRNYLSTRAADPDAPCGMGWRNNWEYRLVTVFRVDRYSVDSRWIFEHDTAGVSDLMHDTGVVVNVAGRRLRYAGFDRTCQFEVESGDKQRLDTPDGQEYLFSGRRTQSYLGWADNGKYWMPVIYYMPPPPGPVSGMALFLDNLTGTELLRSTMAVRDASGSVWDGLGTEYAFSSGALTSVAAAAGESVTVERSEDGRITRLAHSNGQALTLSYDGARLARLDTPAPAFFMTYAYDASGCLTGAVRHTSSGAHGDAYSYAAGGHCMSNRVNAAGRAYRYAYGPCARDGKESTVCMSSELSGGYYRTGFEYGSNANWSVMTEWLSDTRARRKRTEWDASRRITQIATQPAVHGTPAPVSDFLCTEAGDYGFEKHTSASGDYLAVRRLYDIRHNLISEAAAINRDPLQAEGVSAEWHASYSLPLRMWDADGVEAGFSYDEFGRMTQATTYPSPETPAATAVAWNGSQPVSVTDPCGRVTAFSYDALGRLSGVFPQAGPAVQFTNDALGQVRRIVQPSPDAAPPRVTLIDSDEAGRNRTVTYPDGLASYLWHDACRNPTSLVSRAGRRTDLTWLPIAHVGSVTRWLDAATPATVTYKYDFLFNSLAVTDPMGREVERYSLDDEDRIVCVTNLEGQVLSAAYGAGGQTLTMTRFDGVSVSNSWDHLGHLLGVALKIPESSEWTSVAGYAWSTAGRMLSASNATACAVWAYDGEGKATNEAQSVNGGPSSLVSWSYDASGLLTNASVAVGQASPPVASSSYSYDSAGRLVSQTLPNFSTLELSHFTYSYCGWNGIVSAVSNAALNVSYASDLLDRVTNITYRASDGILVRSFSYQYDPDGLITQKVIVGQASSPVTNFYACDGLGRLVAADGVAYAYDLAGNRLSAGSTSCTFTHNRLDGYLYDAAGSVTNMVRNGVTLALSWNTLGQLVSVSTNGAFAESYAYDPLGRRVSTTDNGGTVFHVYDWRQCVADVDASGNPIRSYTWGQGIDNLLAVTVYDYQSNSLQPTASSYFAVKDHLGSVHALVDATGQLAASYTYDAWGNILSHFSTLELPNFACRYLFQGREFSFATGLYNFRARWYDPMSGRWLSKDPIGLEGGLNLYVFCDDDPINNSDPMGLEVFFLFEQPPVIPRPFIEPVLPRIEPVLPRIEPVLPKTPPGPRLPPLLPPPNPKSPPSGMTENYFRPGSYGRGSGPDFEELWRFDAGESGKPGWQGIDHLHFNGEKPHYPIDTPWGMGPGGGIVPQPFII